jgi:hypothetical protein
MRVLALVLGLIASASIAEAQADFSRLRIKPGDFIYVSGPSGVAVSGPLESVTPDSLSLAGHTFKPEPGLRIERRGDPVWDGAAIGAGVGLLTGLLLSTGECGANWHAWQCSLAGGAWGTLLGTLIDFGHTGRTQIFVGASAAPAKRSRAAALSVRVKF